MLRTVLILITFFLSEAATADVLNTGDTAWMVTATALVLFMTLPGLALFYSGLVRSKNVLSVLMQCFALACLMSILWVVLCYGLAFGDGGELNSYIGLGHFLLGETSRAKFIWDYSRDCLGHVSNDFRDNNPSVNSWRLC